MVGTDSTAWDCNACVLDFCGELSVCYLIAVDCGFSNDCEVGFLEELDSSAYD